MPTAADKHRTMQHQQDREDAAQATLAGLVAAINHQGPLPAPLPKERPSHMTTQEFMQQRCFEIDHCMAYGAKSPYRYTSALQFREMVLSCNTFEEFANLTGNPFVCADDKKSDLGPLKDDSYFKKLKELLK